MTLDQALTLLAGAAGIYIALSLIFSIVGVIFYKVWSLITRAFDRKF